MNDMIERARAAVEEEFHTVLAWCQLQAEVKKLRAEVSALKAGMQNRVQIAMPPLSDEPSNAELLQLADQHPAPQEWYDEAVREEGGKP